MIQGILSRGQVWSRASFLSRGQVINVRFALSKQCWFYNLYICSWWCRTVQSAHNASTADITSSILDISTPNPFNRCAFFSKTFHADFFVIPANWCYHILLEREMLSTICSYQLVALNHEPWWTVASWWCQLSSISPGSVWMHRQSARLRHLCPG